MTRLIIGEVGCLDQKQDFIKTIEECKTFYESNKRCFLENKYIGTIWGNENIDLQDGEIYKFNKISKYKTFNKQGEFEIKLANVELFKKDYES